VKEYDELVATWQLRPRLGELLVRVPAEPAAGSSSAGSSSAGSSPAGSSAGQD
jgi:hypothetical protein